MPVKFGTSGLRGLVTEMPSEIVAQYTNAFLKACHIEHTLCVARDLRPSSERIAADVICEALTTGLQVLDCGALPTPALALFARSKNAGAVMVTGSHIPADRNGLKFYTPQGEITKEDETAITGQLREKARKYTPKSIPIDSHEDARMLFRQRYVKAFGPKALSGKRLGIYAHSAVGRDVLGDILSGLGAEVIEFGRSETFIAVDTEAVATTTRSQIQTWVQAHALDAMVSTDGDSDRPLLADETGTLVAGDILGQITAEVLDARTVVTPISSSSAVLHKGFPKVVQTKIGSPYVIAAMQKHPDNTIGYEANGGFILGFHAKTPKEVIAPLLTRDCVLPLVATLHAAKTTTVSKLVAQEPPVVTRSDRLENIPQNLSQAFLDRLSRSAAQRAKFLHELDKTEITHDLTDGLRITCDDDTTIHLRPSGNAPELRIYIEANDAKTADSLMQDSLETIRYEIAK